MFPLFRSKFNDKPVVQQSKDELISTVYQERDSKNHARVLLVIFLAVFLVLMSILGIDNMNQRGKIEDARISSFEYQYHTDPKFNQDAFNAINDFRKQNDLPAVEPMDDENKILISQLEGCAYNIGTDMWDDNDCLDLTWFSSGRYDLETYHVDSNLQPEPGKSNIPNVQDFIERVKKEYLSYQETKETVENAPLPNLMDPETKNVKIMIVGNGGKEWEVIVFILT